MTDPLRERTQRATTTCDSFLCLEGVKISEIYVIIMLFMSNGGDYVSKLRPSTGLLLIPQVIYEYGDPVK